VLAALPSSKLEVMEGQSHIAMITAPYLFARLVISFFAS
jgi:pimeloyl-ACP methyl ester carboxylesterase